MFCIYAKLFFHLYNNHLCICTETILVFVPKRRREGGADCTIWANFPQPWALEYQYGNQICIFDVFSRCISPLEIVKEACISCLHLFSRRRSMLQLADVQVSKLQPYRHSWIEIYCIFFYIYCHPFGHTRAQFCQGIMINRSGTYWIDYPSLCFALVAQLYHIDLASWLVQERRPSLVRSIVSYSTWCCRRCLRPVPDFSVVIPQWGP